MIRERQRSGSMTYYNSSPNTITLPIKYKIAKDQQIKTKTNICSVFLSRLHFIIEKRERKKIRQIIKFLCCL